MKRHWQFIVIICVGVFLRFTNIAPGFSAYHPDEPVIYGYALDMVLNKTLDAGVYCYASLAQFINYFSYQFFFIPLTWLIYYIKNFDNILLGLIHLPMAPAEAKRVFAQEIVGFRGTNALYWGRYITALIGSGTIITTYFISKKLFNRKVALISTLFLAVNYKSVVYAHLGLPDTFSAFFLSLTFLASILVFQKPILRNYVFAGTTAALSFSVKYQFFAFLPLLLAHLLVSIEGRRLSLSKFFRREAFIALLLIPLVFLLVNPYVFINIEKAYNEVRYGGARYGAGTFKLNLYPYSYLFHYDYGAALCIAIILGMFISLKQFTKSTILLLSVLLPFYFIYTFYTHGAFFVRNLLVVTPMLVIFGGVAIWRIFKRSNLLLVFVSVLVAYLPAKNSILAVNALSQQWNYVRLAEWMKGNYPQGEILAANAFDPPGRDGDIKTEFAIGYSYSLAEHKANGAKWALINFNWASDDFYLWFLCSPKNYKQCWNKPLAQLRNLYYGLSAEEIARYGVHYVIKPWQAPDANLILSKIPRWPKVKMTRQSLSSLQLKTTCSKLLNREWLEPVETKPGHLYVVRGNLKRESDLTAGQKEGFLRMDFYKDPPKSANDIGVISTVSKRLSQNDIPIEIEMVERSPEDAKYLVISLQSDICKEGSTYSADKISIEESLEPVGDPTAQAPYVKQKVELDVIYPNSFGGY